MPLIGIPEYLPCHSWLGVDRQTLNYDSGPTQAMRLLRGDDQATLSSAFPPSYELASSNVAVCSPKAPAPSSSAVVAPPSASVFTLSQSYHHQNQRQHTPPTSSGNAAAFFYQKHQPQQHYLQHSSSQAVDLDPHYSKQTSFKMINEMIPLNGTTNGHINNHNNKHVISYILTNSNGAAERKMMLNAMMEQNNGMDANYCSWLPIEQHNQQRLLVNGNNFSGDYDLWRHLPTNGCNGHTVTGPSLFSTVATSNNEQQYPTYTVSHDFHENQNHATNASKVKNGILSTMAPMAANNNRQDTALESAFCSNSVSQTSRNVIDDSAARAKRSHTLTPPNGSGCMPFEQTTPFERQQPIPAAIGSTSRWSPLNVHNDVFSNMNTFNAQALNQNDEYGIVQENGFSPEQSRSSGSGSISGGEQADSPVHQRNTFYEPGTGMRNVPIWLKNLRLHKYEWLFSQLSYDEMLHLTLEQLAMQKICEGARKKIILSIQKLRERVNLLKQLEKELHEPCGLKSCAMALKSMIDTPIRAYTGPAGRQSLLDVDQSMIDGLDVEPNAVDDENLPAHFTRVLYKTCCKILNTPSTGLDDESVGACSFTIDRCHNNDAFTSAQKRRLGSLKQQIRRLYSSMPRKLAPRSNSWNKDRRQSFGGGITGGGMGNRSANPSNQYLHRQSSLGTNAIVTSGSHSRPSVDHSPLSTIASQSRTTAVVQKHASSHMKNGDVPSTNGVAKSGGSVGLSYASAVMNSMNGHGQRFSKPGDNDETTTTVSSSQCRPVQRTISAPPLRQIGIANGNGTVTTNVAADAACIGNKNVSSANQTGEQYSSVSSVDSMVPPYCWPPSSVFSAGPTMPPSSLSHIGSAWSCGFEEATSARTTQCILPTPSAVVDGAGGETMFGCYDKNLFGYYQQKNMDVDRVVGFQAAHLNGNRAGDEKGNSFAPFACSYGSDWNARLDQLCRSITDATLGGFGKEAFQ